MAVLKCSICGGELEPGADSSIGTCLFCGSKITIPKEIERKGHLYNRAVFLRQSNEFDKAEGAYEELLREDNEDGEAHWGLVLSKFGIEYVKDPASGEYLPTCHRTQTESILTDPDYLAAMQYSEQSAGALIRAEAEKIAAIQKRVLEISSKEPPYDIFICYKEGDARGGRTQDSVLAQELYFELDKKGYRVFFARKTLESKLGTEYEPIIYAALSSAKVMVVLGTCADHFNAVWVKNEWSRFLKMSRKNPSGKVIIPTYRGMSPYELPPELASFQSQDMSKIGFMQDLTDGIDRVLHKNTPSPYPVKPGGEDASFERDLERAETFMRLGNYDSAREIYEDICSDYPENWRGWWGVFVCNSQNLTKHTDPGKTMYYVKTLADAEEYANCEKLFVEWLDRVEAPLYTEKEEESLKGKMGVLSDALTPFCDMVNVHRTIEKELDRQESTLTAEYGKNKSASERKASGLRKEKADKTAELEAAKSRRGAAIFFLVVGVIAALAGFGSCCVELMGSADFEDAFASGKIILLICGALVGFIAYAAWGNAESTVKTCEKDIKVHSGLLHTEEKNVEALEREYTSKMKEIGDNRQFSQKEAEFAEPYIVEILDQKHYIARYLLIPKKERDAMAAARMCEQRGFAYERSLDAAACHERDDMEYAVSKTKTPVIFYCNTCKAFTVDVHLLFSKYDPAETKECVHCKARMSVREFLNNDGTPNTNVYRYNSSYKLYQTLKQQGLAAAVDWGKIIKKHFAEVTCYDEDEQLMKEFLALLENKTALLSAENQELYTDADDEDADDEYEDDEYEDDEYEDDEYEDDEYEDDEYDYALNIEALGSGKLSVIGLLSAELCISRGEVAEALESLPACFHIDTKEKAEEVADILRRLGATVTIEKD